MNAIWIAALLLSTALAGEETTGLTIPPEDLPRADVFLRELDNTLLCEITTDSSGRATYRLTPESPGGLIALALGGSTTELSGALLHHEPDSSFFDALGVGTFLTIRGAGYIRYGEVYFGEVTLRITGEGVIVPGLPATRDGLTTYTDPPIEKRIQRPDYPEEAKEAGVQGRVVLGAFVDETGKVLLVRPMQSPSDILNEAAAEALFASEFHPAKRDDIPVDSHLVVPYDFTLDGDTGDSLDTPSSAER